MKKLANEIVLTRDKQGESLAEVLGNTILTLLKENEIVVVRDDDDGIIIVEHEHNNYVDYWGGPTPMWLEDEELEMVETYRFEKEDEEKNSKKEDSEKDADDDPVSGGGYLS